MKFQNPSVDILITRWDVRDLVPYEQKHLPYLYFPFLDVIEVLCYLAKMVKSITCVFLDQVSAVLTSDGNDAQ